MLREVIRDTSALGGVSVFLVIIVFFGILGYANAALQLALALALCYAFVLCIRAFYFKQRPDKQEYENWWQRLDAASFPSLHSMRAAALAWVLYDFFGNTAIGIILLLLALTAAMTRVWLKRHHLSDAGAGLLLGAIIGYAATALL